MREQDELKELGLFETKMHWEYNKVFKITYAMPYLSKYTKIKLNKTQLPMPIKPMTTSGNAIC